MTNSAREGKATAPAPALELAEGIERWFVEKHAPYTGHIYGVLKTLYKARSPFQEIEVVELAYHGKTLILDGKVQSSADSEWIYHEMLVHPVMVSHEKPERVLIIGGGEGATAREVLRHKCVKAVEMLEIDIMVYNACRTYLPEFNAGAFEDPRFSLVVGDGRKFIEALSGRRVYDVVIVDATDPLEGGPAYLLYTREFYEAVKSVLRPGGMMVTQAEDVSTVPEMATCTISIYRTARAVFPLVRYYTCWVPSFDGEWAFVIGSTGPDPAGLGASEVARRLGERGVEGLRYYRPELHQAIFKLPKYLEELLEGHEGARVIRDGEPIYVFSG
mgnify:CR=1 FL=1